MPRKEPYIDREKYFKAIGYKPHSPAQWEFHHSEARFITACCGRRFGKSTMAAHELSLYAFTPDSYYWIVGDTYGTGEKEFRIVHDDLVRKMKLNTRKGFRCSYNVLQGNMRIELPWNTVVEVKSANKPDSILGEGLDGLILAEAAAQPRAIWDRFLRPSLSDKKGFAIFPSTPKGYNWFEGVYRLGQDPLMDNYASWKFPSWENKAVYPGGRFDPEILDMEATSSPNFFKQEVCAEFTAFVGQIYDEWDRNIHAANTIPYNPLWKNFWALDFGFRDPTVCLDIMVDPMDNVYVWREYQVSGLTSYEHGHKLMQRENPLQFHVDGYFADPRGADEIATLQMIWRKSIQAPDLVSWLDGVEVTKRWMKVQADGKPKFFVDPVACPILVQQIEQLRHKETKEGKAVSSEGQLDYNDHGPDALRYFMGPYFVLGANSHLSDVYNAKGSEGESFFKLEKGFSLESGNLWH